ncbi:hypothetical protein [Falsiroseomonas oryziterrae]|uniref:hypothetical protein n=1 Tax=Falsiroseomonas oryziterrae TaxID=2911368 RepID=UPI001F2226A5|nr:hypothetical protein [Roseomonas sp. NPKOSM-4]
MVAEKEGIAGAERLRESSRDGVDGHLIRLCAEFLGQADARTREGERLDRLEWSNDVDAGYLELSRGAHDYQAMLDAILVTAPATVQGLVAKAHVVIRHQQDREAEPIPSSILAADVIRLLGPSTRGGPASATPDADRRQDVAWCAGGRC